MIDAELNAFLREHCLHGCRKRMLLYPTQDMLEVNFSFSVIYKRHYGRFLKCLEKHGIQKSTNNVKLDSS